MIITNYKILERNGIFIVGKIEIKRKFFWSKPNEEFVPIYKGFYDPAHFETLEEARNFVKIIIKPDIYHDL